MNDNYAKFKFEIQLLHTCHESNGDSAYTVSVYKIYANYKYDFNFCGVLVCFHIQIIYFFNTQMLK